MTMHVPEVGVLLGSKSDMALVQKMEEVFSSFGVAWELSIASAHRAPEDAVAYAKNAKRRGIRVIIAAAGLSAALPGVIAAHTHLPVIGIPVHASPLGGLDALLSVAQMPPGVPVAATGVDGAKNAALLAVRILALVREDLEQGLETWSRRERESVRSSRGELSGLPAAPLEAFQK